MSSMHRLRRTTEYIDKIRPDYHLVPYRVLIMTSPNSTNQKDPRQALIEAGVEVFGKYGYDGATTRQIARTAGVNLAAIPYYFGGKEELYRATVQWIVDSLRDNVREQIGSWVDTLDYDAMNAEELVEAAIHILLSFTACIERKDSAGVKLIITREQIMPTTSFPVVHEGLREPLFVILGRIVGKLMRCDPDDPEVIIRIHALISQATFFSVGRTSLQINLNTDNLEREHIEIIAKVIEQNSRAILSQWIRRDQDQGREVKEFSDVSA
ncbi:MAG TPA: hypothetical protein DEB39_00855 [Planctomycetaceae bacterium]|nr:hypothetical protein [Planctomycetaceae bacterium]